MPKSLSDLESPGHDQQVEEVEEAWNESINPLFGLSKNTLLEKVESFVNSIGLTEEKDLFVKGALAAQRPGEYESISELDDGDREALSNEMNKKWSHPQSLWFTIATCSVGAAVQGWDQTRSNGDNLSFPTEFGIGSESAHDKWIVGLINSAPNIAMVVIDCWLSDPLNNLFARRGTIFISAVFAFASVLGSAFTQNWYQLLACRLLLGVGMGIKSSTTSVFAAECSPAAIRGALTMTWQLWVAFGIFLGFSANIAVANAGTITWRLQIGSAMIPAIPLMFMVFLCPESPRWYIKKGRHLEAYQSLQKLRLTKLQAARDLFLMHVSIEAEKDLFAHQGNTFKRFTELFTLPRLRRANLTAGTIMIAQQMCGINIIAFYSSTVFVESGVSEKRALWASWGFGRRTLLLTTFPHMAWTLLVTGLCYLVSGDGTGRLALIAVFILIFAMFYSVGEGPVCYPYAAEVFPLSHRDLGMAWSVAINAFGASVLGLTFPYMLTAMTPTGAFSFYCGLNIIAFVMIFLWVPETKQLTLEELDSVFSVPTTRFMKYQLAQVLPYWVKRWVFWHRDAVKPMPLEPRA